MIRNFFLAPSRSEGGESSTREESSSNPASAPFSTRDLRATENDLLSSTAAHSANVLVVRNEVQMLNLMEKPQILEFRDAMNSQASSGRLGSQGILVRNSRMGETFKTLVDYLTIDRHGCSSARDARALWELMTNDEFFTMLLSHVDVDTSGANHLNKAKQLVSLCTGFHPDALRGPVCCDRLTTDIHLALETSPASYTIEVEKTTVKEVLRVWKLSKQPILVVIGKELDLNLYGANSFGSQGMVTESGTHARPFPVFLRQMRVLLNEIHKKFVALNSLGLLAPGSDGLSRSPEDWVRLTKSRATSIAAIAAATVDTELTVAAISNTILRPSGKVPKRPTSDPANCCSMCGRRKHGPDGCFFKTHPDRNTDGSESFVNSEKGKAYKLKFLHGFLLPDKMLTGSAKDVAEFLVRYKALAGSIGKS